MLGLICVTFSHIFLQSFSYVDGSAHGAVIGDDPIIEAGGGIISVEAEYRLGVFGQLSIPTRCGGH